MGSDSTRASAEAGTICTPAMAGHSHSRTVCLDLVLGKALALSGAGCHCPRSRFHFRLFRLWAAALAPDLPAPPAHSFLEACSVSLQTCPDTQGPRAAGPLLLFCSILPAAGLLSSGSQESLRPLGRLQQLSPKHLRLPLHLGETIKRDCCYASEGREYF